MKEAGSLLPAQTSLASSREATAWRGKNCVGEWNVRPRIKKQFKIATFLWLWGIHGSMFIGASCWVFYCVRIKLVTVTCSKTYLQIEKKTQTEKTNQQQIKKTNTENKQKKKTEKKSRYVVSRYAVTSLHVLLTTTSFQRRDPYNCALTPLKWVQTSWESWRTLTVW